MVIKVLGWKNSEEKNLKDIKQKDTLMLECDKCHKKFSVKFKATRSLLDRQFCKKCKTSDTSIKLYGVKHYLSSRSVINKREATCLNKYGVDNITKTEWYKENTPSKSEVVIAKIIATKRKNHTFNVSKREDEAYELLTEKFGVENVKRQYGDNRYPFACDFYLPKDDTFIECHFNWTHSDSPFDPLNGSHLGKLNLWLSKSKNHPYYKQAAKAWTQYDVKKRNLALTNNLNYLEFFKLDSLKGWLKNE